MKRSPWRAASYAVVDLELTGLDPRRDEIISWCVVPIDDGAIDVAGVRAGLVRPRGASPAATATIHGLREADLDDVPEAPEALRPLAEALDGRVLVAHAAHVERAFLAPALRRLGRRPPRRAIDTALLCAHPDRPGRSRPCHDLTALARELGLPVHAPHTAVGDALTTAQVFLCLAAQLDAIAPRTVGDLLAPRDPLAAARRLLPAGPRPLALGPGTHLEREDGETSSAGD